MCDTVSSLDNGIIYATVFSLDCQCPSSNVNLIWCVTGIGLVVGEQFGVSCIKSSLIFPVDDLVNLVWESDQSRPTEWHNQTARILGLGMTNE